jgi:uncharacterized protein YbjT (DUF2867 family)
MTEQHSIILAGATGLVGSAVVPLLDPARLTLVSRRPMPVPDAATLIVAEPGDWPAHVSKAGAHIAICTLGTTIRQAGSQAAFAAVDRDLVLRIAGAARAGGARQFLMVSSVGANPNASNFYLRTKGEAERDVAAIGFDRVDIFRPGLLRGDRTGPARPGERIAMALSPLTDLLTPRSLDRYRSIAATDVASAILARIGLEEPGVHIHENRAMWS